METQQTHKAALVSTAKILSYFALIALVFGAAGFGLYSTSRHNEKPQNDFVCGTANSQQTEGYRRFKMNCAACHKMDKDLVGPKLNTLNNRDPDWLKTFITNEAELIAKEDSLALYLNDKYSPVYDHAFGGILDSPEYTALKNYLVTEWKE